VSKAKALGRRTRDSRAVPDKAAIFVPFRVTTLALAGIILKREGFPRLVWSACNRERKTDHVPAFTRRNVSRHWVGKLSHYRHHRNDEHFEALLADAYRYTGFHLEDELKSRSYWPDEPLAQRVALLLFLLDRGLAARKVRAGRVFFEVASDAENWLLKRATSSPYLSPTLEFIAAMRRAQARQPLPSA